MRETPMKLVLVSLLFNICHLDMFRNRTCLKTFDSFPVNFDDNLLRKSKVLSEELEYVSEALGLCQTKMEFFCKITNGF